MRKQVLIFSSIFFSFILLIFFYLLLVDRNPTKIESNLIGKEIPLFKAETLIENNFFISSNEFNNEVILVNFFASWCKPCRDEHVYMKKFSKIEKIKIIGINYKDDSKRAIKWLKKYGNPYYKIPIDKKGLIAIDWGVYGIPETFIVNSNGVIKYRHVGPITKKIYEKFKILIDEIK